MVLGAIGRTPAARQHRSKRALQHRVSGVLAANTSFCKYPLPRSHGDSVTYFVPLPRQIVLIQGIRTQILPVHLNECGPAQIDGPLHITLRPRPLAMQDVVDMRFGVTFTTRWKISKQSLLEICVVAITTTRPSLPSLRRINSSDADDDHHHRHI